MHALHTRLLALKRFPTTDEITKLFIFATSLTARVEKTVIVLLFYVYQQVTQTILSTLVQNFVFGFHDIAKR